ncbi:MAG: hypothetical protein AAF734_05220 [Bacteroidota bacterium]
MQPTKELSATNPNATCYKPYLPLALGSLSAPTASLSAVGTCG